MIRFENMLYNITLPSDYWDALFSNPENVTTPVGEPIGLYDVCSLYNITGDDDEEEDYDCDKKIPYDCPVKLKEKCFHT